jgi:hypothetical protein
MFLLNPPDLLIPWLARLAGGLRRKGNIGLWQEKCQEILSGRKLTGNTMNCQDNGRKF